MTHDLSSRIEYSEKYVDDTHEYRYVCVSVVPVVSALFAAARKKKKK